MSATNELNQWISKHGTARDALNVAMARIAELEAAQKMWQAASAAQEHWEPSCKGCYFSGVDECLAGECVS